VKLYIVPSWYPSFLHPEDGTFFKERSKILNKNGFDVITIANILASTKDITKIFKIKNTPPLKTDSGIVYQKIRINPFPKIPQLSFIYYKYHLLKLFKQAVKENGKPDHVFINSSLWAGAALSNYLYRNDIKYFVSEHLKEFLINDAFTTYQKQSIQNTYKYASKIIATSSALKKGIMKNTSINSDNISIVPNPADISSFHIKNKSMTGGFNFISIALLREEKRLDLLLEAYAKIKNVFEDAHITIVGDGPEKNNLLTLVKNLNIEQYVKFTGFLSKEEIASLLQKSSALVLNSDVETFGVALVEAMASGVPAIATQCGGPDDIVTHETGYLINKGSVEELYQSMHKMIKNYKSFNPERIREIAIQKYGDQAYAKSILELCNNL
jgi:L-malate glycosyltransferase